VAAPALLLLRTFVLPGSGDLEMNRHGQDHLHGLRQVKEQRA